MKTITGGWGGGKHRKLFLEQNTTDTGVEVLTEDGLHLVLSPRKNPTIPELGNSSLPPRRTAFKREKLQDCHVDPSLKSTGLHQTGAS